MVELLNKIREHHLKLMILHDKQEKYFNKRLRFRGKRTDDLKYINILAIDIKKEKIALKKTMMLLINLIDRYD
jgi:hypothetical protein